MANCTNCGAALIGKFCSNCGQKKFTLHDLTISKFIFNFFEDFFKFDSNVFRTLRYLLFRPGFLSAEYVKGRIASYVKPLKLFVFTCVVVVFLGQYIAKNDYSFPLEELSFFQAKVEKISVEKNMGKEAFIEKFNSVYFSKIPFYFLIVVVVFTIILSLIFFKQKRVIAEHLVFSLHFFTACLILSLLESVADKLGDFTYYFILFVLPFIYLFFAVRYFYTNKIIPSIAATLFLYAVYVVIQYYWLILTGYITLNLI
ncbi:MAG: DUF3667 domain-containing protein [Bacteroidetes bacterium]|nr:DUF3667 domain-containing protein [Bacteroidota bacterium]